MYQVTAEFQDKIKENVRTFKAIIEIQHSSGVLNLTDKDIVGGSMVFDEASQAGEDFTIGGVVASTFDIKLVNKPEYASINFEGATIIPTLGLLLKEQYDTENYFLNAPQPTEFQEGAGEEIWEYVPLGVFHIDEARKLRNTVDLKAIDNMIELDKPYSLSNQSYPATLYQMYVNACNVCDVQVGSLTFPNKDHMVAERPADDITFRDLVGYAAELAGSFARCNRLTGALEFVWHTDSGITLGPSNRFTFLPREDSIQITGVKVETEDAVYITGTDEYVVDLSDNPLLQENYEIILPTIFDNIKYTLFTPFESRWQGNPALQAGDIVTQTDRAGKTYTTVITHSSYKYRGASTVSGKGLPLKAKGYKGSTNKKITNIVRKEIRPLGDKLTTLEQAQLNATELIANMLGGYTFFEADAFYVADNPILANAMKIWKWGIGGFGYSSTGINGPYTTGITADGSIVANLITAGIVTANMVQTGILQSEDGTTWINLDNGEFNFKNAIKYVDGTLTIGEDIATKDDIEDNRVFFEYSIDNVVWKTTFEDGDKYIRQKISIDGVWSDGVLVKGNDGEKGEDGISVTSVDVEYAQNTSTTIAPTTDWATTAPVWADGAYMWSRTVTTYSTGPSTISTPICITGQKGSAGESGDDGTGITSIIEEYYLSTSKTEQIGGEWLIAPPTWSSGKYMWTRSEIVYNNPVSITYTTPIVDSAWEVINNAVLKNTQYNKVEVSTAEGVVVRNAANAIVVQMGYIDSDGNGTKDNYGLRANHNDGSLTAITGAGLSRVVNGVAKPYNYLTHVGSLTSEYSVSGGVADGNFRYFNTKQIITLPNDFKGKQFNVVAFLNGFWVDWAWQIQNVDQNIYDINYTNGTFGISVWLDVFKRSTTVYNSGHSITVGYIVTV